MTWTKFSDTMPPIYRPFWYRSVDGQIDMAVYQTIVSCDWPNEETLGHWSTENIGAPPPFDEVEMPVIGKTRVRIQQDSEAMYICTWGQVAEGHGYYRSFRKPTKREALQSLFDRIREFQQLELPEIV